MRHAPPSPLTRQAESDSGLYPLPCSPSRSHELVTTKTQGDKRPICYCFGFSEGDARKEIERTGQSTIPATVSGLIKAGMCACEVRNPAGVCYSTSGLSR